MIPQTAREQPQAPTDVAAPLSAGRLVALSVFGILVGLAVTAAVGAMASLPTAAQSGERIAAFYAAHRQVIIAQQVAGALLIAPILGFAVALDRRARARRGGRTRWLILAGLLLGAAELATNLPPLALAALPAPSPATAHTLTLVTDLADVALFAA